MSLVPMIDLFSVLLAFLLVTAVWAPLGRIVVQQRPSLGCGPLPDAPRMSIAVTRLGYRVEMPDGWVKIDRRDGAYDQGALHRILAVVAQRSELPSITVLSEDGIPYKEVIRVMDTCLLHGLDRLGVAGDFD